MKKLLVFAAALLLCAAIMCPALAEYGYTRVSDIPMAVNFTFRVDFDAKGEPHIVTDYPYKATGAEELNLAYDKDGKFRVMTLNYTFATNETRILSFNSRVYPYEGIDWKTWEANVYKDLREGAVTLNNYININTAKEKLTATDWFLAYSIRDKAYTTYEEVTNSQGVHAVGDGGVVKAIEYNKNGTIDSSYVMKRQSDGDLYLFYNQNGDIKNAQVQMYDGPNKGYYYYQKSTGLFSGKKLSELGFSDDDINTPAPAALGSKRDPSANQKIEAYVTRCYQIILGRDPDEGGLKTWYEELNSGRKAAAEIIDQFVSSAEFTNKKVSNADAVEILYKAMLDRPSDPAGRADWVAKLNAGQPLQAVINGFCGSGEFGNLCKSYGIKPGTVNVPDVQPEQPQPSDEKIQAYVARCYKIILGRDADEGGMQTWVNELNSGRKAAAEIIDSFVKSAEFQNKKLSSADAVEILYKAMLDRPSDPAGKSSWVSQLEGGKPLQAVINGFCGSAEFGNLCKTYGINPGTVTVPDAQPEVPAASDEKIRAFVSRCYKIILGRDADEGGMNTWSAELASGRKAAAEIIEQFVASAEFQNKKHSNPDAVEILYKAMLGRGSDAAGKASWVSQLENGQPLTAVINGFCASAEFKGICNSYGITPGTVKVQALSTQADETLSGRNAAQETPVMKKTENNNVTKVEIVNAGGAENENLGTAVQAVYVNEEKAKEFISRCYRSILGREASQAELDSWIGQMLNGSKTPDQIARGFLFSGEFESRNIGGEELVKILYRVYLNREADAEGLATWTQKLNEGTSLQELLNTFSRTSEFKAVVKGMAN